jgi:hypothetical protein
MSNQSDVTDENESRRERNRYRSFIKNNDGKKVEQKHRLAADKILKDSEIGSSGGSGAVASAKMEELKAATDPERKRQLMREYMNLATRGQYDGILSKSPTVAKALEEKIGKDYGINIPSILLGSPGRKFKPTAEDSASNDKAVSDINDVLAAQGVTGKDNLFFAGKTLTKDDIAAAAGSEDMKKLLGMLDSGTTSEINAQAEKLTGGAADLWKELGVSGLKGIKGSLDTVGRFEGDKAISSRAMVAGSDLERVLAGSGVDGKGMLALGALAKGDVGADTLAGLGNISLSKEQRAALKAKGVSETIMKALDADSSGKGLEALVGKDEAKKLMEGGLTAEELGSARLSGLMGEGIGGRVTMSKNGGMLTTSESKSASELATQMESIAKSSLALADVVQKLQEKQRGWFS